MNNNRLPITAFLAGVVLLAVAVDVRLHSGLAGSPTIAASSVTDLDRAQIAAIDHPGDPNAWAVLADAYAARGDVGHAQAAFERARTLAPGMPRPEWALTRWMSDTERALVEDPLNDESWGRYGTELVDKGRPADAIPYLLEALRLDPTDSEWLAKLAECPRDARVDAMLRTIDPNVTDDELLGDRGDLLKARGELDTACRFYARAADLDPADSEWTNALIACGQTLPEYEDRARGLQVAALSQLALAAEADPQNDEALGDYADALFLAGRTDEACRLWGRALTIDPSDSEWPESLGKCPSFTPSIVAMLTASAAVADPGDEQHGDLGDALWSLGRHDEACAEWQIAHQLDREDSEWVTDLLRCGEVYEE